MLVVIGIKPLFDASTLLLRVCVFGGHPQIPRSSALSIGVHPLLF